MLVNESSFHRCHSMSKHIRVALECYISFSSLELERGNAIMAFCINRCALGIFTIPSPTLYFRHRCCHHRRYCARQSTQSRRHNNRNHNQFLARSRTISFSLFHIKWGRLNLMAWNYAGVNHNFPGIWLIISTVYFLRWLLSLSYCVLCALTIKVW